MTKFSRRCLLVLTLLALSIPATLLAKGSLIQVQKDYRELFKRTSQSVVAVSDRDADAVARVQAPPGLVTSAATDCGFVVEKNYLICNPERFVGSPRGNLEEWDPTERLKELKSLWAHKPNGDALKLEIVGFDIRNLLMVCKLPEGHGLPSLKIGNSMDVGIGENVAAIGNAFDSIVIDGRVSFSIASLSDTYRLRAVTPYALEKQDLTHRPTFYRGDVLELEGAVNPGDYGGPVIDMGGAVIGMMTRYVSPSRQLGTAVPSAQFHDAFKRIIEGKEPAKPTLGFSIKRYKDKVFQGKIVSRITEGGPADQAGLRIGDVIQVVDGLRLEWDTSLRKIISWSSKMVDDPSYTLPPGAHISMVVMRDGKLLALKLRAGGIPFGDRRDGEVEGAAAAQSRGQAELARVASKYVVQVVIDRRSRPGIRPAVRGDREREAFMDLSVGPYTGVIASEEGHILIADTILGEFVGKKQGGKVVSIRGIYVTLPDGRSFQAEVSGRNSEMDLAMLKIDAEGLEAATFRAEDVKRGESIAVVTRSFGIDNYGAAMGICSAQNRDLETIFQLDARVGASDLGGLVVDKKGNPVGIVGRYNIAVHGQASGVAYAIHASTVLKAFTALKDGKFFNSVPKPLLGVRAAPRFADEAGLRVLSVTPGFPAALAGLEEDDVIMKANDVDLFTIEDLRKQIAKVGIGNLLKLNVTRAKADGTESELELTARIVGRDG